MSLCEEPGAAEPIEVDINWRHDSPRQICAGHGNSFVVTKKGILYSWGHGIVLFIALNDIIIYLIQGNFGVLGHGFCESIEIPRRVRALEMLKVKQISTGSAHTGCRHFNCYTYLLLLLSI